MIKCSGCSNEMSIKAASCPKCGHPNAKSKHLPGSQIFITLLLVAGGIWWFAGGGLDKQTATTINKIQAQVAADAVTQYQMAKRQGDKMQICVQAGLVSAAYLQTKDESNFQQWKQTEISDCRKAGISR